MEEFTHCRQRVQLRDWLVAVHGHVAKLLDGDRLGEDRRAHSSLEARLMQQRVKMILIGELQRLVILVEPSHSQLQRATGIEAGCAGIGKDSGLGFTCRLEQRRPFRLQEAEVRHRSEFSSECAVLERGKQAIEIRKSSLMPLADTVDY